MNYKVLGENIRSCRKGVKMTQEELAEKANLSTVFISQLETGVRKPSLETVFKLSCILNVSMDELVKNTDNSIVISDDAEITMLLKGREDKEIRLITGVAKEILRNLEGEKVCE